MLVKLRAFVTVLVAVHLALLAPELRDEGVAAIAWFGLGVLVLSTAWSTWQLRSPAGDPSFGPSWAVAMIDAIALVAVARVTVEVEPTATIAWAFVLWSPFSIAVRARPAASIAASGAVAALVLASTVINLGALDPLDASWTQVGVPVLLVLVTGAMATSAAIAMRRSGQAVQRELAHERDRTLRLREADDLKNTFLSAVSHELRTPLTSILGFAVTMLDRPELDDEQRERMLQTIVGEAEHLEDILANLLDLDRLTRGKVTLVPVEVDPAVVVRAAVEHVRSRSGREVQLDLQEGLYMQIDAAKVERIVENLVGNAVKYTPADAEVHVRMREERGGLVIRVDDTGPGIGRELRETIFEPFRRGVDVGVPGTGIGLSLVDRFSRMHGGRAWVEERPGGGCRFQVFVASLHVDHTTPTPWVDGGGGSARPGVSVSSAHG